MKRFLTIWLCIVMIIAMLPMATGVAFAADDPGTLANPWYIGTPTDSAVTAYLTKTSETPEEYKFIITGNGDMCNYTGGPNSNRPWYSYISSITNIEIGQDITNIGDYVYNSCKKLTSVEIPASVTSINHSAFRSCTKLENVTFAAGSQLKFIGEFAFQTCRPITSIEIPASVINIGMRAFESCSKLATVTCLATTPPSLGADVFASCTSLTSIYVPNDSVSAYRASWTDYKDKIKPINPWEIGTPTANAVTAWLDNGTLHIEGTGAMQNFGGTRPWYDIRNSITKVIIGDGVTNIGIEAFSDCNSMKSITIPASVTSIGPSAFSDCIHLENLDFASESNLNTIGAHAFDNCNDLKSITIPAGVTQIEENAFYECEALKNVTCLATTPPTLLGNNPFYYCASLTSIYVPYEAVEAYKAKEGWSTYADIIQAIPGTEPEPQAPSIGYFVYDVAQYNAILAEVQKLQAEIDAKKAAEEPAATEKLTASEAKAFVETMVPTVRTENQARGIKVFVKDSEEVAKFKAAGYKVLYDFYRAESKAVPKADDYKITTVVNKEEPWYLNTAAKKGKKYYYKAVAKVYDANGELVAETELTQGKYGCRTR